MSERWTITIEPTADPLNRPADVRLASLLRIAGRTLGLRVVDVAPSGSTRTPAPRCEAVQPGSHTHTGGNCAIASSNTRSTQDRAGSAPGVSVARQASLTPKPRLPGAPGENNG